MNILDKIIIDKRREVLLKKSIIPVSQLEASVLFERKTISLKHLMISIFEKLPVIQILRKKN